MTPRKQSTYRLVSYTHLGSQDAPKPIPGQYRTPKRPTLAQLDRR